MKFKQVIQMNEKRFTLHERNQIFTKIQDLANTKQLTMHNMRDLHEIFTAERSQFSSNSNGPMYVSSKYSDATFQKLSNFLSWFDSIQKKNSNENEKEIENKGSDLDDTMKRYKSNELANNEQKNERLPSNELPSNEQKNDELQTNEHNGTSLKYITVVDPYFRFKYQKPDEIYKKEDVYKRLIKKTRKIMHIPIHFDEKNITAFSSSFNQYKKTHVITNDDIINSEDNDDENDDLNEDENDVEDNDGLNDDLNEDENVDENIEQLNDDDGNDVENEDENDEDGNEDDENVDESIDVEDNDD